MAAFRRHLSTSLSAFLLHQETELARIPADLKRMTIDELDAKWGGGWAGTMLRLTEERRAEAVQRDREAEERLREEANGQRWVPGLHHGFLSSYYEWNKALMEVERGVELSRIPRPSGMSRMVRFQSLHTMMRRAFARGPADLRILADSL